MEDDIELYVKTCLVCQQDKTLRQQEAGLLQPLSIPDKALSVNFDRLHYWVFKGGWHEHYHGCHRQIHQVFDVCG